MTDPADQRFGRLIGGGYRLARDGTVLVWPFAGLLAVVTWRRRDASLALLLLPAAYGFGVHAAATHFIPRYSLPLLPVLVVVTALAVHELLPRADQGVARLGTLALAAVRRRLPAGGGHSCVNYVVLLLGLSSVRNGTRMARLRRTTFVLFVGGILACGGYMLNRFDLVNLLRDVNADLTDRVGGRRPAIRRSAPASFDVYLLDDTLVYAKEPCVPEDVDATFFLHVDPIDPDDLPGPRRRYGYDNLDFRFDDRGSLNGGVCAVEVPLPGYGIEAIRTGQFVVVEGVFHRLWEGEIRRGSGPGRR